MKILLIEDEEVAEYRQGVPHARKVHRGVCGRLCLCHGKG